MKPDYSWLAWDWTNRLHNLNTYLVPAVTAALHGDELTVLCLLTGLARREASRLREKANAMRHAGLERISYDVLGEQYWDLDAYERLLLRRLARASGMEPEPLTEEEQAAEDAARLIEDDGNRELDRMCEADIR